MAKRAKEIEYGPVSEVYETSSLICAIQRLSTGFNFNFLVQFTVSELEAYKNRLESSKCLKN